MRIDPEFVALGLMKTATPVLFFTGDAGAGRTAMAIAAAQALADQGRQVMLVGAPGLPLRPRAELRVACASGPSAIAALLAQDAGGTDHRLFDVDLAALVHAWRSQPEALPDLHRHDALLALADPWRTTVVLVSRPDATALLDTARLHEALLALDVRRQWLLVVAPPQARVALPESLKALPRDQVTLQADTRQATP